MTRLFGWVSGLIGLAGLMVAMRGRVRGPYARWRLATAYGDAGPRKGAFLRDALRVGAWRRRVVRLGRSGGPGSPA